MTNESQNFWNFSTALYARESVANACLDLQNSYDIDVNILLFCYWHGLFHGEFPSATLQKVLTFSADWKQSVVQPLRNVRNWMKQQGPEYTSADHAQYETLRSRIKFDELAAEKYQQEMLEQVTLANANQQVTKQGAEACSLNIENYFAAIDLEMNDLISIKLRTIAKTLAK